MYKTPILAIFGLQISAFCFPILLPAEDALVTTESRLREDLSFFAADELEGRNVGSDGIAKAGEFIAKRFSQLGIRTDSFEGSPFQDFSLPGPAKLGDADRNSLNFEGLNAEAQAVLGRNFTPLSLGTSGKFEGGIVFAGYGITAPDLGYDDYKGLDVEGKIVIILRKEPQQQNPQSIFDGKNSSQYAFFSSKELNAALHKVAAVIMVNDEQTAVSTNDQLLDVSAGGAAINESQVPTFYCSRSLIDPILKQGTGKSLAELEKAIDSDITPRSQQLSGIAIRGEAMIEQSEIPVRNVIGLLPGTGNLASEYVVVGAHYDHVGMGGPGSLAPGTIAIHNGADDNGSGTTTMLEVARRMAADQSENRRSIVFMAFTGEEKGLLGSKHYVRNPRWPLENTVAMVNMDMVGRLTDNNLTVYGTGTAKGFDGLVEHLNEAGRFALDKQEAGFGPSDHASFYEANIPVFHFFTGLHNDYHRPSDDVEKVNFEGMARIASMVSQLVLEISTAAERPAYIKTTAVADVGRGRGRGRTARAVLGIQLDLSGDAAAVGSVPEDSPAALAGLKAGDVIVKIGDTTISSVRDLRSAMAGKKPGEKVPLVVQREGAEIALEITLGEG